MKKFLDTFEYTIDTLENSFNDALPSCKILLLNSVQPIVDNSIEQSRNWDENFNYTSMVYKTLYNLCFDLLSTGRFHIYKGILNPLNESQHLLKMLYSCLDYYVDNNYIDKSTKNEQLKILEENIANVG